MSSPGTFRFGQINSTPSPPPAGYDLIYVKTDDVLYIQDSAGVEVALGSASSITSLTGEATAVGPGAAVVTLSNSAVIGKVLTGFIAGPNSPVLATDTLLEAIEKLQAQTAASAGSAITSLTGDVSGTGPGATATTVNSVGGKTSSDIASAVTAVDAATSVNTASTLVERDASGNFAANIITASLTGNVTGNVSGSSATFTGSLSGDVSGTQSTTSVDKIKGIPVNPTPPTDTEILIYNSTSAMWVPEALGGDVGIDHSGTATIQTNVVTNAKLAQMASNTVKANITGSTANAVDVSLGTVTESTSTVLTLSGWSDATIGSPTIEVIKADSTHSGYLSSTDWNTFNSTSGAAITALTGDATATGPGSVALTLATVNGNAGSFGSAGSVSSFTVNAKGLITAASSITIGGLTNSNLSGSAGITGANIATNTISNNNLAQMPANTVKANITGIPATPIDVALGTVTEATSAILTLTGWSDATVGSPTIQVTKADATHSGYLSSTDWNTFNNTTGSAITALTGDVVATGPGSVAATIQTNVVNNSKLAQMPANTIKGNNTGATANAIDLTSSQVNAMLPSFVGDTGLGGTQGIVPAPPIGSKAAGDFLSADGSWDYVDQSKPRYPSFSLISQTLDTIGNTKFENTILYTGITGKQYSIVSGSGSAATMTIFDVTNQAAPVIVSSTLLSGSDDIVVNSAPIGGKIYAFVGSSGAFTMKIIDITNPYAPGTPVSLTITGSPGSIYGISYYNGYCYLATQASGLVVVDVGGGAAGGTITVPVQCFQEGGGVKSFGVTIAFISGVPYVFTTQYVTSVFTIRQIKSWSISTPQTPSLLQSFQVTTSGETLGISVSGNTAVVTSSTGVYDLVDVTSPSAMANLSQISAPAGFTVNSAFAGQISGNYLFLPWGSSAVYGGAIQMFDITNRSTPIPVSIVYTNVATSVFGSIAVDSVNGYIYAGDYGVAPGSTGTLDIFTMPLLNVVAGNVLASTINGALTGNVTGNLTGNVTGNVSGTSSNVTGIVAVINGGTGLATTSQNFAFIGPVSGGAGAPSWRVLAAADIPSLSGTYLPLVGGTMSGSINMGNNSIVNTAQIAVGATTAASGTAIDIVNSTGATQVIQQTGYGAGTGHRGRYANGTLGAPTAATTGNVLEFISGRGYGATGFAAASTGNISIVAAALFSDTSMPTYLQFNTTPSGSTTSVPRMQVAPTGNVLVGAVTDDGSNLLQVAGNVKIGTGTGASEVDLNFANSNTGTLAWNPGSNQKILLPPNLVGAGNFLQDTGGGVLGWGNPLTNIDGGSSATIYTASQVISGGTA